MEQIQNTIHKDNNGFSVEIHHTVLHDSINSACDIVNSSPTDNVDYAVRPQGQSKRKWKGGMKCGSNYFAYDCACGKKSGNMFSIKRYKLWLRLHKKKCLKN